MTLMTNDDDDDNDDDSDDNDPGSDSDRDCLCLMMFHICLLFIKPQYYTVLYYTRSEISSL
jgi:hypothetical protein